MTLSPSLLRSLLASALIALLSSAAQAQEKINLRIADSLPPTHEIVNFATKYFMDTVTKETNGQVTFQYFGSEQLGKARDLLALTLAGATDIGYTPPSFAPEKLPLGEIAQIPGLFQTACQGTNAYIELATKGVLASEFKQNNIRPLIIVLQPPNGLFMTRIPATNFEKLKGLKIRSTGAAQDLVVKSLGAVPIRTTGPEVYESLSRGTVDGMTVSYNSLLSYSWIDVAKFGTLDTSFGSFVFVYSISDAKFNSLPENVRNTLVKVGWEASRRACEAMQEDVTKTQATLREKGMTLAAIEPGSKEAFQKALDSVGADWAANMDRRGKKGTQTLKEFRAAVK